MKYFGYITYDGSNFHGSSINLPYRTVEEEFSKVLSNINNKSTKCFFSSRLDKGVHAVSLPVCFEIEKDIKTDNLLRAINSYLPKDIYLKNLKVINEDFLIRKPLSKTYKYLINVGEYDPLIDKYTLNLNKKLDIEKMKEAAIYLLGEHDFYMFTEFREKRYHYIKTIYDIKIREENNIVTIRYSGNSFLKYQIRYMTGLLIDIGLGKKNVGVVKDLLDQKEISRTYFISGNGLYLEKVEYGEDNEKSSTN